MTPSSRQIVEWLLVWSLQASFVVLLVVGLKFALRRWIGPRGQYALWLLVIARLLIPMGPECFLSINNLFSSTSKRSQPLHWRGAELMQRPASFVRATDVPDTESSNVTELWPLLQQNAGAALLLLWVCGFTAVAAGIFHGHLCVRHLVKHARPVESLEQLRAFESALHQAQVARPVPLLCSPCLTAPALIGVLRPVIVVPPGFHENLSADELRYVFLHELAHVRQHDTLWAWVAGLLQAIHWFNPILWWAFHQMRQDRELTCDAEVLQTAGEEQAHRYGCALLKIAQNRPAGPTYPLAAGILETKSELRRRIVAITRFQSARRQAGLVGWAAAAFVFVVGFTEAELRETDGPPAKPSLVLSSDARRGSLTTTQALQHQVPFSVVVAEHDGVLEFKYGSNQEPERLIAQKAVVLTTPETTISCAVLTYDYKTRELDAQGPELQVEQRARGEVGEVRYVADAMHWNTESGEWRLEGSPVVYQKQRNGTVAVTRGDQIRVFERNGMRQFRVSGPQNILKTTRSGPDAAEE